MIETSQVIEKVTEISTAVCKKPNKYGKWNKQDRALQWPGDKRQGETPSDVFGESCSSMK